MHSKTYYVYFLVSNNNTSLYIGISSNLRERLKVHNLDVIEKSFSHKYQTKKLVYFEAFNDIRLALKREKQLKGWVRRKKNKLVESKNPYWLEIDIDNLV